MPNRRLHLALCPSAEVITPAEAHVLELAALRDADIAMARGTSLATIRAQKQAIKAKLSADTWTEAALLWERRRAA